MSTMAIYRQLRVLSKMSHMKLVWLLVLSATAIFVLLWAGAALAAHKNHWVSLDGSGHLVYQSLAKGDRIVDFSHAGYMGGGVPLPHVSAVLTVKPSGADDTAAIQHAIDEVSSMPLQDGFRGAVLLAPGTFSCSATLHITASGVVLRGSGAVNGGTTLKLTGEPHIAIAISGSEKIKTFGPVAHIAELYVPSGAQSITLDDASSIAVGDTIRVTRYTTPQWLHHMGMDKMVRDGEVETWVGNSISTLRMVAARHDNELRLDVPLTDSYDRSFLPAEGADVTKVTITGRIEQDGIESLHIAAPARSVAFTDSLFRAVSFSGIRDAWIRDVMVDDTTEGIDAAADTARMTFQEVFFRHTTTITSSAKPADFALRGTQLLMERCGSIGDDLFYVITGPRNQGPNVVMDSKFLGNGHIQPHQRWATGFLVDNTQVAQGGIDLMNRGEMGSGHGWTMGWGVVWNSSAATLIIQNPPGAANWSIGTSGKQLTAPMKIAGVHPRDLGPDLPQGFIESPNHRVLPDSLYRAQLTERLGINALKALD
jgi:hypothetical protein